MSATKPKTFAEKVRRLKACVTDDPETIRKLSKDPSGWVREGLLYNPKVDSDDLFRVAKGSNPLQHGHICMHPNVDGHVMAWLAQYPQTWTIGRAIATHPETLFGTWMWMRPSRYTGRYTFQLRKLP